MKRTKRPDKATLKAAAKRLNLSVRTIEGRVHRYGMSWEEAMTKPKKNGGKASRRSNPGYGDTFVIDHRKDQVWDN